MTLIQKLKHAAATALATVAMYTGALAQEKTEPKPVKMETRIYAETRKDPAAQTIVSYDGNKLMAETSKDNSAIGADFNYNNLRLNLGWRDTATLDQGKAYLSYRTKQGFAGLEFDVLDRENNENKIIWVGGLKLDDNFGLEAALDSKGNNSGVVTAEFGDSLIYAGGHIDKDNNWEANASYSQKIGDAALWSYIRVGNNNFLEACITLGSKQWAQRAKVFGVDDEDFNSLSVLGDLTFPLFFKTFSFSNAEIYVGKDTWDYGIDAKYTYEKGAAIRGALNVGDYFIFNDVTPSAEYRRNFANDTNGVMLGLRFELGNTGLRIWYKADLNENTVTGHWDDSHAVLLEWTKEF